MNCLSNIQSLPLSVSESTVPMEIAGFFCKFISYCGRWLLTAETCRTLTLPHLLRRQQILAVEQLQVPLGISFDTAVVEGEECTYKAVGLFKPHVTILTACKCTEMFFPNSEDAQEAKISTSRRPRGSQLTEALLPTACEMLCSVPIPSSKPVPSCRCSGTYSESRHMLHAVLGIACLRPGCCKNQHLAGLRCFVLSPMFASYW